MSLQPVKDAITRFLTRESPGVLVLKGPWGVGKTHAWHEITGSVGEKIKPASYAYVSLFGINSLDDLRTTICVFHAMVNSVSTGS
jgi:chromosomal replication initiation ATPase DnaA